MQDIEIFLRNFKNQGLYPDFRSITKGVNQPVCQINEREYVVFCANNYLGMTENVQVKSAAKDAIDKYGVGPGGSRVISGNVEIVEYLEKEISELVGAEDCLTFPTGYMANITVFAAMMDPLFDDLPQQSSEGVIFSDEYNHGSIIDGCKLSSTKKVIFEHNNIDGLLNKIRQNDLPNKLIVTEGVFSLEGEIINLPKYIQIAKDTGSKLMVDDAHGVGILGEHGGGIGEYWDCARDIDILMGCLDKSLGGTGGYLGGSATLIEYLRIASRSSLLSSAIPTMMAGAMIKSIDLVKKGHHLRKILFENSKFIKYSLINNGFRILGDSDLPAVPLYIGDEILGIQFSKILWELGILCPVIRWPAVPKGKSRLRIIVMSSHTRDHINRLIDACKIAGKKIGIIR